MANQKLTQLTNLSTPADEDLLYTVDDPAGTPASRKITWATVKTFLLTWLLSLFVKKVRLTLGTNPTAIDADNASRLIVVATYTANTTTTFSNVASLDELVIQLTNTNANTITFAGLNFEFKASELPDGVSFATNALTFPADSAVKYNIVGVRFDGTKMRAKIEIN